MASSTVQPGCFQVFRDTTDPKDIHFKRVETATFPEVPIDQLNLKAAIERTLSTLRVMFASDEAKFDAYYAQLLSLAQAGLAGASADVKMAENALAALQHDVVMRESGNIKNRYLIALGVACLKLAAVPLLAVILLHAGCVQLPNVSMYLHLVLGAMAGVWLSFGSRKVELTFEELATPEKDRLTPGLRVLFAALLTAVFGLLLSTKAITLEVGGFSTAGIGADWRVQLLVGVFCGLSEQALSNKVYQSAAQIMGEK